MVRSRTRWAVVAVCTALLAAPVVTACSADSADRNAAAVHAQVIVPADFETADASNEDEGINVDSDSEVIFQNDLGEVVSEVAIKDECWSDEEFRLLCASSTPSPADLDLATISRTGDTFTAQTTADSTYLPAHLILTVTSATKSDPGKTRSRTVLLTLTCC
ncbi:MAG: hypothetical protein F2840_01265 [Actinobacteria bacterium]|uniref:Unannotated protein n=1 Tax=freshwater metagenome TaxID=449393 RepID=A0A6J7ILR1_9ZZZZ|nr:hypothetical protein [Actinomycetota bacterium]